MDGVPPGWILCTDATHHASLHNTYIISTIPTYLRYLLTYLCSNFQHLSRTVMIYESNSKILGLCLPSFLADGTPVNSTIDPFNCTSENREEHIMCIISCNFCASANSRCVRYGSLFFQLTRRRNWQIGQAKKSNSWDKIWSLHRIG